MLFSVTNYFFFTCQQHWLINNSFVWCSFTLRKELYFRVKKNPVYHDRILLQNEKTQWKILGELDKFCSEGIKITEKKKLNFYHWVALSFQNIRVTFIVLYFIYAIVCFNKVNSWVLLLLVSDRCQMRSVTGFELIHEGWAPEISPLYSALRLKGHMQL